MREFERPVEEWLPHLRALLDAGHGVPLVVLAFDNYRIGHGIGVSFNVAASVAAVTGASMESVLRDVATSCATLEGCERLRSALLGFHEALDALPGISRGIGMIPSAERLQLHWRGVTWARGLEVEPSLADGRWRAVLEALHARGVRAFSLETAVRRRWLRFDDGAELGPLTRAAALETVAAALGVKPGEVERAMIGALEEILDASGAPTVPISTVKADLETQLRALPHVVEVRETPAPGLAPDTFVPAQGKTELLPPWEVFPEPPSSMRWRMGPGEDHMDTWLAFWRPLGHQEKREYVDRHLNMSAEWSRWLLELERRWG